MSDKEPESMNLEQLNGAVLKWEDKDGTIHRVEFGDSESEEVEPGENVGGIRIDKIDSGW